MGRSTWGSRGGGGFGGPIQAAAASAALAAAIPGAAAPPATGRCGMDKRLEQLVEKLKKAYGERLVSVVLYGSAAAGDHHEGFSDFNILCVLSGADTARTGRLRRAVPTGGANRAARRRCCSPNTSWPPPPIASPSSSTTCKQPTPAALWQRCHSSAGGGRHVLPRASGARPARQAAAAAPEGFRNAGRRRPAAPPAARFRFHILRALPPRSVAPRRGRAIAKTRGRRLAQERFGIDPAPFEKLLDVREKRMKAERDGPASRAGRLPARHRHGD
jgi:hypothetical protein